MADRWLAPALLALVALVASVGAAPACLAAPNFSGTWTIDLRTPADRQRQAECGNATFELLQTGDKIQGDHAMATVDCGRLNEGGEGTVTGVVTGNTAVLVVTSGRNGAIMLGTARLLGSNRLRWQVRAEVKPGEPPGDSPLILQQGILQRPKGGAAGSK